MQTQGKTQLVFWGSKGLGILVMILVLLSSSGAVVQQKPFRKRPPAIEEAEKRADPDDWVPAVLDETELTIVPGERSGTIAPLLGVNAGPSPSGEQGNADLTRQFKMTRITAVRTHDFYGPFDLSRLFPDLGAPPGDPASYRFAPSDEVFQAILRSGCSVYLRLGDSYNDVRVPRTPAERKNLADAAVEVVRHFRQLGANRNSPPLLAVEIGNEPDLNHFWPPGLEDFQDFFIEVFLSLKKQFPDLKIGGPGFAMLSYKLPREALKARRFLESLRERSVRPDFLSFHIYSNHPAEYYDAPNRFREMAEQAGWGNIEEHVTEWNVMRRPADPELITGKKAASYFTAFWIAMQMAGVRQAYVYRANDTSPDFDLFYGIFYADGRPKPSAAAFRLWSKFCDYPNRITLRTGKKVIDAPPHPSRKPSPFWLLGAENAEGKKSFLFANISAQDLTIRFSEEFRFSKLKVSEIRSPETAVRESVVPGGAIVVPSYGVMLLEEAD